MDDYIKREDALDLCACDFSKADHRISYQGAMIEMAFRINEIPADEDVVKVVRCKDCAFSDLRRITDEGHTVRVCEIWGYVDDTHFCNDGRRWDDGV